MNEIGNELINVLSVILQNNKKILELSLARSSVLHQSQISKLLGFISLNAPSIQYLNLAGLYMQPTICKELIHSLKYLQLLVSIDVSENSLDTPSFAGLLQALEQHLKLTHLNFAKNQLLKLSEHRPALSAFFFSSQLVHLNVQSCQMNEGDALVLLQYISLSRTMQSIHLTGNDVGPEEVAAAVKANVHFGQMEIGSSCSLYTSSYMINNDIQQLQVLQEHSAVNILDHVIRKRRHIRPRALRPPRRSVTLCDDRTGTEETGQKMPVESQRRRKVYQPLILQRFLDRDICQHSFYTTWSVVSHCWICERWVKTSIINKFPHKSSSSSLIQTKFYIEFTFLPFQLIGPLEVLKFKNGLTSISFVGYLPSGQQSYNIVPLFI